MKFTIFSKAPIATYPLVLSVAYAAKELGYEVQIVTQNIEEELKLKLEKENFSIRCIQNKTYNLKPIQLLHWLRFSQFARKEYLNAEEGTKLWITGADTAIALGLKTLKKRPFYFQINELYDLLPHYLKRIKAISQYAKKNIVPERNRAAIFQVWFNLKIMPSVLPNKPFIEEELISKGASLCSQYLNQIKTFKSEGKTIVLYQGHIGYDRDFSGLLKAIDKMKNIVVVLMGATYHDILEKYKNISPNIYYIPSISTPYHLLVTQMADIGILTYLPISLNNIYCAPNKIWEYAKYGLAIIGNDIVGLDCITHSNMGFQCNLSDEKDVLEKIELLMSNLEEFKKNSLLFYSRLDFVSIVDGILKA